MRKLLSVVFALMMAILLSPWLTGIWFEHSYRQLISYLNSKNGIEIQIVEYHRGWLDSHAVLNVYLMNSDLFAVSDITNPKLSFTLKQNIQHGPILYRHTEGIPSYFGLASLQSILRIQDPSITIKNNDMISFSGKYFKNFILPSLEFTQTSTNLQMKLEGLTGSIWVSPRNNQVSGQIFLKNFTVKDLNQTIHLVNPEVQFNQAQVSSGLWIGKIKFISSEIIWRNLRENSITLSEVEFYNYDKESTGHLKGIKNLNIKKMDIDGESAGPLHLQISSKDLNANAIVNMIEAYRKIKREGELYKSQLKQKLSSLFPRIFSQKSEIKLDAFNFSAPEGNLKVTGKVYWPFNETPAAGMWGLFEDSYYQANLRISQTLLNKVVNYIGVLPYFRTVSLQRRNELIKLQENLEAANQRNFLFLSMLVDYNAIPEQSALGLLSLQKNDSPMEKYSDLIKNLFLSGQITRTVSYMLLWQYSDVKRQINLFKQALDDYTFSGQKEMHAQIEAWIKQGYLAKDHNDYVVTIKKENGITKINGKEI